MSRSPLRTTAYGVSVMQRIGPAIRAGLGWLVYLLGTAWAAGAIYVDGPQVGVIGNAWLAAGWTVVMVICLIIFRGRWTRSLIWLVLILVVLVPWLQKQPSNERDWNAQWKRTASVTVQGGSLIFHNVRNFDYGTDGSVTERWVDRTVRVSNLRGVDYVHVPFGGDLIAHIILSFDFGPDGRIALSVETRREIGESYSEIGGLYKMFELQYVWGDERDLIRVRTNILDEPIYLYRTSLASHQALYMLLDSVRVTNWLHHQPAFYNVVSANCTTSLLAQTLEFRNAPFDYRMLANGRLDELIYEAGGLLDAGADFTEARRRAFINPLAQAAHEDPDFSQRIREGRPEFD